MSLNVMIMVELTSETCSCLVNMLTRDHGVLFRSGIGDDGDEISHTCLLGALGHPHLAWSQRVVWAGVVVDWSAVEHSMEPFGVPGGLGGLGSTRTNRPDLF